jgi:hypothetical protein
MGRGQTQTFWSFSAALGVRPRPLSDPDLLLELNRLDDVEACRSRAGQRAANCEMRRAMSRLTMMPWIGRT